MQKQFLILLTSLLVLTLSSCNSKCKSCSFNICYACNDDSFLYSYTCIDCNYCNSYNSCDRCTVAEEQEQEQDDSNTTAIIIITVCVVISVLPCICICYKKCNSRESIVINRGNVSDVRLVGCEDDHFQWKQANQQLDRQANCAICLDNAVFLETRCHHTYHPKCLYMWVDKGKDCPLCKSRQLSPVRVYVQIDLKDVYKMSNGSNWMKCPSCKQLPSKQSI